MTIEVETRRDIVVDEVLPHAPDVIWKALTTAELIGRWLMPNDFVPVVGCRFTFKTRPIGDWDGVVRCEVLEIEPNRRLVYSWRGGSDRNAGYGGVLDSVVTWTLTPVAQGTRQGTRLRLVHSGFRSPDNDVAFNMMSLGWDRIVREGIGRVIQAPM